MLFLPRKVLVQTFAKSAAVAQLSATLRRSFDASWSDWAATVAELFSNLPLRPHAPISSHPNPTDPPPLWGAPFWVKRGQQPGDLMPSSFHETCHTSFSVESVITLDIYRWLLQFCFFFCCFFAKQKQNLCPEASFLFPTQHFCRITRESPLKSRVNTSRTCDLFFWNE